MNNTPLQPHQQRVVDECTELHKKTTALGLFFGSKIFLSLPIEEQKRLNKQWQIMQQYGLILTERIAAFHNMNTPNTDTHFIQPKITGYRQLSETEVALMNEGKALAEACGVYIKKLREYVPDNGEGPTIAPGGSLDQRWISIGATDLQRGFMSVIRGIAQPTTF